MTTPTTVMNAAPPAVGQKAPQLALNSNDGKAWSLRDAVQKGPVVVCFLPGAFSGTCTKEMCNFTANWSQYERLGSQVVGVSVDSKLAQNAWTAKENIKILLLSDFEKKVSAAWGVVWASPWGMTNKRATFVVDRTGTVRYANVQAVASDEPNYADIQAALQGLK